MRIFKSFDGLLNLIQGRQADRKNSPHWLNCRAKQYYNMDIPLKAVIAGPTHKALEV